MSARKQAMKSARFWAINAPVCLTFGVFLARLGKTTFAEALALAIVLLAFGLICSLGAAQAAFRAGRLSRDR